MNFRKEVEDALYKVIDPELGINIVDLGLVYNIMINDTNDVHVIMTLTTPGCPLHDSIVNGVKSSLQSIGKIGYVDIQLVWEPAWSPEKMSNKAREMLK